MATFNGVLLCASSHEYLIKIMELIVSKTMHISEVGEIIWCINMKLYNRQKKCTVGETSNVIVEAGWDGWERSMRTLSRMTVILHVLIRVCITQIHAIIKT